MNLKWVAAGVLITALMAPSPAFGQACAMCYNTAAAAKAGAIQALRSGILVLLIPVLVMFAGIFVFAFRSPGRFEDTGSADSLSRPDGISSADDWEAELAKGHVPASAGVARTLAQARINPWK